jgi:NAD(P)-dependent dehydrogenase (short-subunit alcohol dehydrogenase family)
MTISENEMRHYAPAPNALRGKVIAVTGASDGIGRACALRCAELGATVLLISRTQRKLEAVYDEIVAAGGPEPAIVPMDFQKVDGGAFVSLAETIQREYDGLDGLVHCAGILGDLTPIEHYDGVLWQQVLHVNLTVPFALTKLMLPLLRKRKGSVVFVSSSVGRKGRAHWGAYAVSKFGIEGLAQTLAAETRQSGVRVNVVNPGATRTEMRRKAYPGEDRAKLRVPEDVLPPFMFFLSDDSAGVTGLSVDAQR